MKGGFSFEIKAAQFVESCLIWNTDTKCSFKKKILPYKWLYSALHGPRVSPGAIFINGPLSHIHAHVIRHTLSTPYTLMHTLLNHRPVSVV